LSASPGCWPSSGRNHWCSLPVPRTATATPACSWSARSLSRCPGSPITTTSASTCSSGRHGGASSWQGGLPPPDSAARAEAVLQGASIWVVCVGAVADGERGGAAGGFAGGKACGGNAGGSVGFVGGRDAAPSGEEVGEVTCDEDAVGDVVGGGQPVGVDHAGPARLLHVDREGAEPGALIAGQAGDDVPLCQGGEADDAP